MGMDASNDAYVNELKRETMELKNKIGQLTG